MLPWAVQSQGQWRYISTELSPGAHRRRPPYPSQRRWGCRPIIEEREVRWSWPHPSRPSPSRRRSSNHCSHDNLQEDLTDRRMANPVGWEAMFSNFKTVVDYPVGPQSRAYSYNSERYGRCLTKIQLALPERSWPGNESDSLRQIPGWEAWAGYSLYLYIYLFIIIIIIITTIITLVGQHRVFTYAEFNHDVPKVPSEPRVASPQSVIWVRGCV